MEPQDVEYDSVTDYRVAISDDEDADNFAADEGNVDVNTSTAHAPLPAVSVVHPGGAVSLPGTPGPSIGDSSVPSRSPASVVAVSCDVSANAVLGVSTVAALLVSTGAARDAQAAHSEAVTPLRGASPASEPAGILSAFSWRFLPSFFQMGRPLSAPVTQTVAASDAPPPTVTSTGRAVVSAAVPYQGAGVPIMPGRAASPTRANRVPPVYSIFQDHLYSGPVSASPGVPVPLQW